LLSIYLDQFAPCLINAEPCSHVEDSYNPFRALVETAPPPCDAAVRAAETDLSEEVAGTAAGVGVAIWLIGSN
jgi:hypothetical protein